MTGETIVFGFCAGVAATVTMDVLASASRRVGLAAGAKGQWVGRWYLGIARGHFVHSNIAVAPEQTGEIRAALVGHYAIGIALAVLYVAGAGWFGVSPDVFLVALGYGFATSVFPWFLVFPALDGCHVDGCHVHHWMGATFTIAPFQGAGVALMH